jgi:mannose-6-phosphate isomerase-like protein (cupin superfamily)
VITQGTIEERIRIKDIAAPRFGGQAPEGHHRTRGGTGWHSHDADVLAVVATGTLTLTDHHCSTRTIAAGHGFTERPGHVHQARNLGSVPVEVYVTYVSRPGAQLRVDQPAPHCSRR